MSKFLGLSAVGSVEHPISWRVSENKRLLLRSITRLVQLRRKTNCWVRSLRKGSHRNHSTDLSQQVIRVYLSLLAFPLARTSTRTGQRIEETKIKVSQFRFPFLEKREKTKLSSGNSWQDVKQPWNIYLQSKKKVSVTPPEIDDAFSHVPHSFSQTE